MSPKGDSGYFCSGYSETVSSLPSLIGGLTALSALGALAVDHGIYHRSSQLFDRSVYRGCENRNAVALTFDDGPGPGTPPLLAYLREQGIRATFFQSGMQVERYPEITRQVCREGHEIGNHGFSHKRLSPKIGRNLHLPTPRFMYRELAQTQRLLTSICGTPPRLFRAPYGMRWIGLDAIHQRLGLIGVQWTVIGHDWEWPAERVAPYVLARVVPGAIICLHDGRDERDTADTAELMRALKLIVPVLRERNYRFETVSELLVAEPASMPVAVG